jgi:acyl-coenzyme A thioesterase PaaI-like protein
MGAAARIAHHDLCFGCGLANVFGLQLELEERDGVLAGRFFVKQDHQGPSGLAHGGVLATALGEAMSLAVERSSFASPEAIEIKLRRPAQVGTYLEVEARVMSEEQGRRSARAELRNQHGELVAEGSAQFVAPDAAR